MTPRMLQHINQALLPLENLLKQYRKYIGYFLLLLAFASFGFLLTDNGVKDSGQNSMLILLLILWIPIFARVFGLKIFQAMMPLRKELGILMGTLAFVHSVAYIAPYPSMIGESYFWLDDTTVISYLAVGFVALVLSIPLTLTSSKWAMRKMGKYWKILHRLVYIILILSAIHIVLIDWAKNKELELAPIYVLGLYFGCKVLEWQGYSFAKKETKKISYPIGQKWLCVPCGYIYDPVLGDEEDGIAPGTEFSDIPDDWRCPLCGVTKADFVPYTDGQKQDTIGATVISREFLNPTTIELVIETQDNLQSKPGQFVTFAWSDSEGDFTRSYSIAAHDGHRLTFLIKLGESGRGARILRNLEPGARVRIRGIFGNFVLQESPNPKVFIATGTGLAPIYNMIKSSLRKELSGTNVSDGGLVIEKPETKGQKHQIQLYFTVATEAELFYTEELKHIENLDLHIHITKEKHEYHKHGRVDVDAIVATSDTEWYLCGNPRMIDEATAKLRARGYDKVYTEEFN